MEEIISSKSFTARELHSGQEICRCGKRGRDFHCLLPHDVFPRVYAPKTHPFYLTPRLIATSRLGELQKDWIAPRKRSAEISALIAFAPWRVGCCRGMQTAPAARQSDWRTLLPDSHGSPRDSFVVENPLLYKIQYPPGGTISSGAALEGRAIPESACSLIGGILDVAEKILSQLRRAVCSRCGSMNPTTGRPRHRNKLKRRLYYSE